MAEWTPVGGLAPARNSRAPVRLAVAKNKAKAGMVVQLHICREIMARLGTPDHLMALRNGSPSVIGLRGVDAAVYGQTLKPNYGNARRTNASVISAAGLVMALGKAPADIDEVPHHWDGDVLVLDLSGLPDAEGGE